MIAHVLSGSPMPLAVQWLFAVLFFGGGLATAALHSRRQRILTGAGALCGLAGIIAAWVLAAVQPGPAPYVLRIVSPAANAVVTNPVALTICGFRADGGRVPATDAQHYLVVFVDGSEVATVDRWQLIEVLPRGTHTVKTELVTPAHHAFDPPQIAAVTVSVQSNPASPSAFTSC